MKRLLLIAVALVWTGGMFIWGFMSHRQAFFPYNQVRALARRVGLWSEARMRHVQKPLPRRRPVELLSIPYIEGTIDANPTNEGVILYDRDRAWDGVTLVHKFNATGANLIDMEGKVLWKWSYVLDGLQVSAMTPNGDLLGLFQDSALVLLDKDSKEKWIWYGRVHHGFDIAEDGTIYVITTDSASFPQIHPETKILDDRITMLTPDGKVIDEFSLVERMLASPYAGVIPAVDHIDPGTGENQKDIDPFHTNSVDVFDGALADRSPLFAKGNMLVSIRNLNALVILDGRTRDVLWLWGPNTLIQQHHATLLPNGHILVFNNGWEESEVLELDPLTRLVAWRYEREGFYSKLRGSCQRLPNGNTMITESDSGYLSEVTPEGEIVWRYANPEFGGRRNMRSAIYRATRYSRDYATFLP